MASNDSFPYPSSQDMRITSISPFLFYLSNCCDKKCQKKLVLFVFKIYDLYNPTPEGDEGKGGLLEILTYPGWQDVFLRFLILHFFNQTKQYKTNNCTKSSIWYEYFQDIPTLFLLFSTSINDGGEMQNFTIILFYYL